MMTNNNIDALEVRPRIQPGEVTLWQTAARP